MRRSEDDNRRRRLKYVASLNDDALNEGTDRNFELQYIDIGNVHSSGSVDEPTTHKFKNAPSRARRRVRDGDIIVSCVRTYLQAIAQIQNPPTNLVVSTGFAVVRPAPNFLDSKFAGFALRESSFLAEIEKRSVGVSYPAINALDLAEIPIHVPPLGEQRAIADYLGRETARLDTLVTTKEHVLRLLAEKRQALITEAVLRGVDAHVSLCDFGIPWIGDIPRHWEVRKIARLFCEKDQRDQPDLQLLEVSINQGVVVREFSDDRIESTAADFNIYKVARRGDIVFNKMRMWQGAVGVAPEDGLVSPDYVVARPSDRMSAAYASLLFRTPAFSAESARHSRGIVWDRLRLYWQGFREITVPLPSVQEQHSIVGKIESETRKLDELAATTLETIALLRERRSAVIAEAVTGQLDLGRAA